MKNIMITPKLLNEWGACADGKKWGLTVIGKGMSLKDILPKFERADWMVWTLRKAEACTKVQYAELAIICAKTVLSIYEMKYPEDDRPRKAIEAAMKYCKNPTEENRKDAANAAAAAADAAYAAAADDDAAADANAAAANAAADAAYAAAAYAAYAADAAAYAAYDAADAADAACDARKSHHKKMCALLLKAINKFGKWEKI